MKKLAKRIIKDDLVPLKKNLPDSLDLTLDTIKSPNPDKTWLDQLNKIGNLLSDLSVDFYNKIAPNIDVEEGVLSLFTDRLNDLEQAYERTKDAMDEIGFNNTDIVKQQPGQEMVYSYHQGFFQMAIIQLTDIFSDVISIFLGLVVGQDYITDKEVLSFCQV